MTLLWMLFAANGGASAATPLPPVAPTAIPPTEIIVTGSRVATRPDDLAANVTVLSRADFDVEKPARLADLLRRVAGVHIDQVGGRGGTGSLYMRGADPNYTLVLVDGVRVNDPTNARGGSFDFSTFDVADVERVEVARGPYSAVYGGDALAGVVNIVTRRAPRERTQVALDAMGGAYDTRRARAECRRADGTRQLEPRRQRQQRRRSGARQPLRLAARLGQRGYGGSAPTPRCTPPGATPSRTATDSPTTAAATSSPPSATPRSAMRTKPCSAPA